MELKCEICGEVFKSNNEKNPKFNISLNLNKHIKNVHNLTTEQYIINVYYNGKRPLCACGCDEPVKFVRKNCFFTERYPIFENLKNIFNFDKYLRHEELCIKCTIE